MTQTTQPLGPHFHAGFEEGIDANVRVEIDEFQEMLVSNRELLRCDCRSDNTRGVYDPKSKTRYYIPEHELFEHSEQIVSGISATVV